MVFCLKMLIFIRLYFNFFEMKGNFVYNKCFRSLNDINLNKKIGIY